MRKSTSGSARKERRGQHLTAGDLEAFRKRGVLPETLLEHADACRACMTKLERVVPDGWDALDDVVKRLRRELVVAGRLIRGGGGSGASGSSRAHVKEEVA